MPCCLYPRPNGLRGDPASPSLPFFLVPHFSPFFQTFLLLWFEKTVNILKKIFSFGPLPLSPPFLCHVVKPPPLPLYAFLFLVGDMCPLHRCRHQASTCGYPSESTQFPRHDFLPKRCTSRRPLLFSVQQFLRLVCFFFSSLHLVDDFPSLFRLPLQSLLPIFLCASYIPFTLSLCPDNSHTLIP